MTPNDIENCAESLVVGEHENQLRLDAFLVLHFPGHSRVRLQKAISKGRVTVEGKQSRASARLKPGQIVVCQPVEEPQQGPIPEDIPLEVVFEDESLVAINKPANMVVHPAKGHWSGTLTAALAFHFETLSSVGGPTRPGIVHRLDRDTTGIILVAKTDQAHTRLSEQFQNRSIEKEYLSIVTPEPDRDQDIIDKPIGDHPYQREKKAIRDADHRSAKNASSVYTVVERLKGFALVSVRPRTVRTHKIRVHLAHVGCPVLCDKLYRGRSRLTDHELLRSGDDSILLDRQALHAFRIKFDHPLSGDRISLEAELPGDMARVLEVLRSRSF